MALISFANAKGGAGKTTASMLLATELAFRGETVAILDCDPLAFATRWATVSGGMRGLSVISGVTSANLVGHLRSLHGRVDHVVIDLSGARDVLIVLAAGLSDLCLIPVQGSIMDAQGAAHVLDLIGHVEGNARARINHAVVLTRVSSLVTTRAMRSVKTVLAQRHVALLDTPIIERSAYRDMVDQGVSLYQLNASAVSNLAKAQLNMQRFAADVMKALSVTPSLPNGGPFARICYQSLASNSMARMNG